MKDIALLVVDAQRALIRENPYDAAGFLSRLGRLIGAAREGDIEVVFVRHDGGAGDFLAKGEEGFEIAEALAPLDGERVFDKRYGSAFRETALKEYLDSRGIDRLMIVGMQTEYCVDATAKAASERGYKVVIPEGATTTFDTRLLAGERIVRFYEDHIWKYGVAEVAALSDAIGMLR